MHKINFDFRVHRSSQGFSLVEALMGLAIISLLLVFGSQSFGNLNDSVRTANIIEELDAQRIAITGLVDCAQTLKNYTSPSNPSNGCTNGVVLLGYDGLPILDAKGVLQGGDPNWQFIATCGTKTSINVSARVMAGKTNVFYKTTSLGTLNFANQQINPILGDTSPFKLCANWFKTHPRVADFLLPISSLPGISPSDCAAMNSPTVTQANASPTRLSLALNACNNFCVRQEYLAGYISQCNAGARTVRCGCIR